MKTICMASSKGGTSKTVSAWELAAGLTARGYRVLMIDMDCQGSLSSACGIDTDNTALTLKAVLDGEKTIGEVAIKTPYGDIVPNSLLLFDSDRQYTVLGSLRRTKKALQVVADQYDYAVLDANPAFNYLTLSAMIAADVFIVPQLASLFSGLALSQLKTMLELVKGEENPDLKILGIVLTRWNPRTRFSKDFQEVLDSIAENLGTTVYETKIRQAVAIEESLTVHKSIFDYAPGSRIAEDYDAFVDETLRRLDTLYGKDKEN